ncbi:hypothetical protein T440DRAFT_472240 [Plenodomus tracheiphilus IPT5]|uniref:Uncharacterized protein n=1 Tax=Plenodomus tracheiphilus IPT5 TaxID=1408161 RepID=A0A6A7AT48_9PLEO|nr:hypothetical protein T440DRAFT_472240 [Plenodomus tracheiphilus IPT5]
MAPVENAKSNSLPIAIFGGQIVLVTALTANVLVQARRAAKSLPPSTRTRSQNSTRRRNAVIFSLLAAASLAAVSSFAFIWRAISYIRWAENRHYATPNSILGGWSATGTEARWHLGDWISDIDLVREFDSVGIMKPEGFLYTSQYFVGLLAAAIFMGAEGRRRNLSTPTIASFVLLCSLGSLGFSLSLFFVTILYTPTTVRRDDSPKHDAFFTPSPIVYDLGIVASLVTLNSFPELISEYGDKSMLRLSYLAMPLFFAFAPQIVPVSLGHQHTSKAAAHRSYAKVFYVLSLASLLLYWRVFVTTIFVYTPSKHTHVWDLLHNSHGKNTSNRLLSGISIAGQRLKVISKHPAISVTSLDVLFSIIALLTWTFTRDLDVDYLLESSVFSFLAPKHEKHVAFKQDLTRLMETEPPAPVEPTTPRKRGRPSKSAAASVNGASAVASAVSGSLRRSSRRKAGSGDFDAEPLARRNGEDSDGDSTYQPSEDTRRAVAETEADGAMVDGDVVHAGESTALALFLAMIGGVGQLASAVLGAEVTGP